MTTETNATLLFQLAMAAKMIETRHKTGCNWSVEMVVRDAAGRIIMQIGDEPQAHWQTTIPEERKVSESAGTALPLYPVGHEDAKYLGLWRQGDVLAWAFKSAHKRTCPYAMVYCRGQTTMWFSSQPDESQWLMVEGAERQSIPSQEGHSGAPDVGDWLGPDWSQAPEGAVGWVAQKTAAISHRALWIFGPGNLCDEGLWTTDSGFKLSKPAPLFGYTGHWRDSLRKRAEVVEPRAPNSYQYVGPEVKS